MYEFLRYRVADVMTREPVTIRPEASLADAHAQFARFDFDAFPVVSEGGRLVGLLTKLDMLDAFRFTETQMVPSYESIMAGPVRAVMTTDVERFDPSAPVTKVLQRMVASRFKSFPVCESESGDLVGIIAREDVLRALTDAVRAASARPSLG